MTKTRLGDEIWVVDILVDKNKYERKGMYTSWAEGYAEWSKVEKAGFFAVLKPLIDKRPDHRLWVENGRGNYNRRG
jgi:hypothetical protein